MKIFQKKYLFNLPIYGYNIHVIVTMDLAKSLKKEGFEDDALEETSAMHFPVLGRGESFVFIPLTADINDIAHEGMHVAQSVIDWIGATYKDREFVAYLVGYVIQGLYEYKENAQNYINTP